MTVELCLGRPPEWWEPKSDGARLAITICRRCPSRSSCLANDPDPKGVIRAGIAFSDTGATISPCPTCGYPRPGTALRGQVCCPHCDVPNLSRWRNDIKQWFASGVSDAQAGRWVGATPQQIKDARRSRGAPRSGPRAEDTPSPVATRSANRTEHQCPSR